MPHPNILWICTDQQRFDTLGCYGNRFVQTPHLDRLAGEGVRFEHVYAQNPVCSPSRAAFLTGRYPRTNRCRQNGQMIPADEVLVPRLLRDAGYVCGLSGKLHLAPCYPDVCKGTEPRIDDGYDAFYWSHDVGDGWPTNQYRQWLRERGVERSCPPSPHSQYVRTGPPEAFGQTVWCVDRAISFLRNVAGRDRPWLFSVNCFDPHHPFDPPAEALERYADALDELPPPNYVPGELADKPVWQQIDHEKAYGGVGGFSYDEMSEADHRWVRAAYWAMVDVVDRQVGRLLGALDETGQRDETIVIFTSDHGEMLGDHGIYLKGPYFYEPAVGVPLIVAGPGIAPGCVSTALVELFDLAPTLLDACGLDRPAGMQARSFWPLLTGAAALDEHRQDVYSEFYGSNFHYDPPAYTTMLRTRTHKLTVAHGQSGGELYDLRADPTETRNLWSDPASTALRADLLCRLTDRMAFTADPLPPRQAPW